MQGWVKLHRCLAEKAIWKCSTPEQKTIFVTLLLMANHKENEWLWQGKEFKAEPGQFVTSIDSIKEAAGKGISTQNVRSALGKFQKLEFLTNVSTKTGRLITILNWEKYQVADDEGNKDTNKEVTKSQQTGNKEVTPNKNDKNDKNDKKIKQGVKFTPPTIPEIRDYCKERNNNIDPEHFHAWYSAKGWMVGSNKMKDWKQAVITWEKRNNDSGKSPQRKEPDYT
jgi:hypothetical protein